MASGNRDGALLETQKSKVKPPPMYQVILLNDDFTPMEFVVGVLQKFFGKGPGAGDADHAQGAS